MAQTTNINPSASAKVIFEDSIRQKPRQANLTIDVVIPVLNEESCIGGLLHDVMVAKSRDWFQIQNIYVISDASTDKEQLLEKWRSLHPSETPAYEP
ncbi:hypothetical protein ACFLV0_03820 [Chloroflexota bacterium]